VASRPPVSGKHAPAVARGRPATRLTPVASPEPGCRSGAAAPRRDFRQRASADLAEADRLVWKFGNLGRLVVADHRRDRLYITATSQDLVIFALD